MKGKEEKRREYRVEIDVAVDVVEDVLGESARRREADVTVEAGSHGFPFRTSFKLKAKGSQITRRLMLSSFFF